MDPSRPHITVKAAMTLDGKIATAEGASKWITGEKARAYSMRLRRRSDAILVGVNTVCHDDPSLTVRTLQGRRPQPRTRIILDTHGRIPSQAKVVTDSFADRTIVVVGEPCASENLDQLDKRVAVVRVRETTGGHVDILDLLPRLTERGIRSILVEGGGAVHGSFFAAQVVDEVALFYAPMLIGGIDAKRAVANPGASNWSEVVDLTSVRWRRIGEDLLLTAKAQSHTSSKA